MSYLFEPENLLPQDGIALYYGVIYPEIEANQLCHQLFDTIPWKQDEVRMFGKILTTKRKIAWFADPGIHYTYAGVKKEGLAWIDLLLGIKQKVEAITGAKYNACLLNLYHEGAEGMGYHKDNEKEIISGSSIASLSFGVPRRFSFKHALTNEKLDIELDNGSLLEMKGDIQQYWYHALPKTKKVKQMRINLTFRMLHQQ